MKMYNVILDRMKRFNLGCDINNSIRYCQRNVIKIKLISVYSNGIKSVKKRKKIISNKIILLYWKQPLTFSYCDR